MSEHELLLSDFDFDLPLDRIAQFPLEDRSSSRLLHVMPDRLADYQLQATHNDVTSEKRDIPLPDKNRRKYNVAPKYQSGLKQKHE